MGCCFGRTVRDPNAPTSPPDSYPRNPAYANQYNSNAPAPIVLPPSGGGAFGGDAFIAGAAIGYMGHHGGIQGALAPEGFNPMTGGYDMV